MAIHRMYVSPGQKPTEEQVERIRQAASFPITYDEDCPELTDEQYAEFARIAEKQRALAINDPQMVAKCLCLICII